MRREGRRSGKLWSHKRVASESCQTCLSHTLWCLSAALAKASRCGLRHFLAPIIDD